MAEVSININGRPYGISCEEGQQQRVMDLGHYVDSRLKEISKAGAASSEAHLFVLTALLLSDEVFDLHADLSAMNDGQQASENVAPMPPAEDLASAQAIEELAGRIDRIAGRIQAA